MQVYVIRHTKVDLPSGICYGQSDLSLRDTFFEEASNYLEKLEPDFCKVYSSPLQRCSLLAKAIGLPFEEDKRLMEMNFGAWENTPWQDIASVEIDPWYKDFVHTKTPEGESFIDLFQRVEDFVKDLRQKEYKRVLIVTHSGVMRSIYCYILGIPLHNAFKIQVQYGDLMHFNLGKDPELDCIYKTI